MKALVKVREGAGNVELREVERPAPGPGEVRVQVMAAGICGTDIHIFQDSTYPIRPPIVLGHELSGVVDQAGNGVEGWLPGQRVVSETYFSTCGRCIYCKTGRKNLCAERLSIGSGVNGAMAQYVTVPAGNLHAIPDHVTFQEAALTEPLACCVQAVYEKARLLPGDRVLLTGPGAIGLLCLQAARQFGCRCMMAGTRRDEQRLQLAKELGAEQIVYIEEEDIAGQIAAFGPTAAFECSGAVPAVDLCLSALPKGGQYIQVGLTSRPAPIDTNKLTLWEISMAGSFAQKPVWWNRSIDLIARGGVNLAPIATHTYPLERWEEAFQNAIAGEGLKHVLLPNT